MDKNQRITTPPWYRDPSKIEPLLTGALLVWVIQALVQ